MDKHNKMSRTSTQKLSVYGFCMLFAAALVGLFAMSIDYFVVSINNIIVPCQHDSIWINGKCVCENTKGIFGGEFCETCQCEHLGLCRMSRDGAVDTRWGCQCPNHQKWVGIICNKCYTRSATTDTCVGDCLEHHYGSKCNTFCQPDTLSALDSTKCAEITAGGGVCNACNGHGSCTTTGSCDCDPGYFTARDGSQCTLSCDNCPQDRGVCQSIGGSLQCVCNNNYFGTNCEQSCGSSNNLPCSGHGSCQISNERGLECVCNPHYIGDDCSTVCPGRMELSSPCSGHGTCEFDTIVSDQDSPLAKCVCESPWSTFDCGCVDEYTCNGHGTCNPNYDGTNNICDCLDDDDPHRHYGGQHCERCQDNWWGSRCQLYCDPHGPTSTNNVDNEVGCNGHGSCIINNKAAVETITCECQSNYESKNQCAECKETYYPKVHTYNSTGFVMGRLIIPPGAEHCSVPCSRDNECHSKGMCNTNYDTTNAQCECDQNGKKKQFDTLDSDIGCSACKPNWYPNDLSDSATRCTRYCAATGTLDKLDNLNIIRFGTDLTLQNDVVAQQVCTSTVDNDGPYQVNPNCHVCSNNGVCDSEGACSCNDGTTGSYCEIDCGMTNGKAACSGHGKCIRDELEMWFFPNTDNYRCECLPYDPYTSETRQNLAKQGFQVDPPPSANYFGKYCDYHCPTYNSEICADRGSCDTQVATDTNGMTKTCTDDTDCRNITGLEDAFCAVLSTPWDSITPRFFSSGAESAGYQKCTSTDGSSCIDAIYSVDWGNFCVQMLNGWYPNELNTAECAFDDDYRVKVEDYFMNVYKDDKTWCENALEELTPFSDDESNTCTKTSHPNDENFETEQILCHSFELQSSCSNDDKCVYDQTLSYIYNTDIDCAASSPDDCNGPCRLDSNQVCKTKTYCRAKNCQDAIMETSLESLCFDLEVQCPGKEKEMTQQCSKGLHQLRNSTEHLGLDMSSTDIFFICAMYENSHSPLDIEDSTPGSITIDGIMDVMGRQVPVEAYRSAVLFGRTSDDQCVLQPTAFDDFCLDHLQSVLHEPTWYQNEQDGWFLPWRLKCGEYTTLWESHTLAKAHQTLVMIDTNLDCAAPTEVEERTQQPWSMECLSDLDSQSLTTYRVHDTLFPTPSAHMGCTLHENVEEARWGQQQWTHSDIENIFQQTCLKSSESPAIPPVPSVRNFCDTFHPCGDNKCTVCTEANCGYVECDHSMLQPVCGDAGVTCGHNGKCISQDLSKPNMYKCQYTDPGLDLASFQTLLEPIVVQHQRYKDINWLEKCSHVTSRLLETEQLDALDTNWFSDESRVQWVAPGKYLFKKAVLKADAEITMKVDPDSHDEAMLRVTCDGTVSLHNSSDWTQKLVGTCTLETYGTYLVNSVTVNGVESLAGLVFKNAMISPSSLQEHLKFGLHPQKNEWSTRHLVTFDKSATYTNTTSTADNNAGMKWNLSSTPQPNARVSGWVWLSTSSQAKMMLLSSDDKVLVEMTVTDGMAGTTELKMFFKERVGDRLVSTYKTCRFQADNTWIRWYIEAKHVDETVHNHDDATHHHQTWQSTVVAGDCTLSSPTHLLSRSRRQSHQGRLANSFHNVADLTAEECHQHCDRHADCLQWSWVESGNHCYLYEKRCHEDKTCRHGTHTLHSSMSHLVNAFTIDTDSPAPVTWAHLRHDEIVEPFMTFVEEYHQVPNISVGLTNYTYESYTPDVTTVCNDLAATFEFMPGYATHICGGGGCENTPERTMARCGQYLEFRHPDEVKDCPQLQALNWTAYCYYKKSFHVEKKGDNDELNFFPILAATSTDQDMETICAASDTFRTQTRQLCSDVTDTWYMQCLGRWETYEDFCAKPCLTQIEQMLSSNGENDPSICEIREKYIQLNVTGGINEEKDRLCSANIDNLIVTDFCNLQNAYHDNDKILIPELHMSSCQVDCREMLQSEMTRPDWREWCYRLSSGTIDGVCSRTACDCDTENNIGVAGDMCELTCPSGTENGKEVACSGRNGRCLAMDFNDITADYTAQETAGQYRNAKNNTKEFPIPDNYKPLWLRGPNPSATGICQCALGSGDSCAIPCADCNNGTYGIEMSSQYGLCDAYFGICRSLPPFMRLDVKSNDNVISFNSTAFTGMEWQNPDHFLYENDQVLLDNAIMEVFDYTSASVGIESVVSTQLSFERQQAIVDVFDIFPTVCTPNGVWLHEDDPWGGKGDKYLDNDKVTNNGVSLTVNETVTVNGYLIEQWGGCLRIDMNDEWDLCFEEGQLRGMTKNSEPRRPLLVISSGDVDEIPKTGLTFAKASTNSIYAFGGTTLYRDTSIYFNSVYKISLRPRGWGDNMVVMAKWSKVKTVGSMPAPQREASILYFYNELYVLSNNDRPVQSAVVNVSYGYQQVVACQGTPVHVTWQGVHDIQEVASSDCASSTIGPQLSIYQSPGHTQTFTNDELSASAGSTRFFKCSTHCGASASRFEVSCPSSPSPKLFVLGFTLDGSPAKWTDLSAQYEETLPSGLSPGSATNMVARTQNVQTDISFYIYIDNTVVVFQKEMGFALTTSYPPRTFASSDSYGTFQGINELSCTFEVVHNASGTDTWSLELGGNQIAEYNSKPLTVFVYLEEWLNMDTSVVDFIPRFFNTIEWRTKPKLVAADIVPNIKLFEAVAKVEKIYMSQARWNQGEILLKSVEMYQQFQQSDVHVVDAFVGVEPSQRFLNIIKENEGSLFENKLQTALPTDVDGRTLFTTVVEGQKYARHIVISGHRQAFTEPFVVKYPYTEELKLQNGVLQIVVHKWDDRGLNVKVGSDNQVDVRWDTTQNIQTFHIVIHVEKWMYNDDSVFQLVDNPLEKQGWHALLNMFVSIHSEPTHFMKSQTNRFIEYYGSHCSATAGQQCPGILPYTKMACSGHGRCNAVCGCECELAPSILQATNDDENAYDNYNWQDSPWRGDGCEITCPGFDGYDLSTVCGGKPEKCGRDGTCSCNANAGESGDACQFKCSTNNGMECSGHGACGTTSREMDDYVYTSDTYKNRIVALNRKSYSTALEEYYYTCQEHNYYPTEGKFVEASAFRDALTGGVTSFYTLEYAINYCDSKNSEYSPSISRTAHLIAPGTCVGIQKDGGLFKPMKQEEISNNYQVSAVTVAPIISLFACTFSDCELSRHADDKKTLSNIDFSLDSPIFEFNGWYQHGSSSGELILSLNGRKVTLAIYWDITKLQIGIKDEFTNVDHIIINKEGEFKHFTMTVQTVTINGNIDSKRVDIQLYYAEEYKYDNLPLQLLLTPHYGIKYRRTLRELDGYSFNIKSPDTGIDTPLLSIQEAEYACDTEELCTGVLRWKEMRQDTYFSMFTSKTSVGDSIMYPISTKEMSTEKDEWTFFEKMSLFYKGKEASNNAVQCSVIMPRQAKYPKVSLKTTYNIAVTDVILQEQKDPETQAVQVGNGVWTNCWEKVATTTKFDCFNECSSKDWYGFAFVERSDQTQTVCLCYHIKKENIQLDKYYSADRRSVYNPCDASKNRQNPNTEWLDI